MDTVNTSSFGVGVNSQSIVIGDTLRLDYVTSVNLDPNDSKDINLLTYGNHYTVNDATFKIIQTGGNAANTVDVEVKVFDADDDNIFNGDAGDVQDVITSVKVFDDLGVDVTAAFALAGDITFNSDGFGGIRVDNLLVNYRVEVSTADGFKFPDGSKL